VSPVIARPTLLEPRTGRHNRRDEDGRVSPRWGFDPCRAAFPAASRRFAADNPFYQLLVAAPLRFDVAINQGSVVRFPHVSANRCTFLLP
jgi:hypothetical protein